MEKLQKSKQKQPKKQIKKYREIFYKILTGHPNSGNLRENKYCKNKMTSKRYEIYNNIYNTMTFKYIFYRESMEKFDNILMVNYFWGDIIHKK